VDFQTRSKSFKNLMAETWRPSAARDGAVVRATLVARSLKEAAGVRDRVLRYMTRHGVEQPPNVPPASRASVGGSGGGDGVSLRSGDSGPGLRPSSSSSSYGRNQELDMLQCGGVGAWVIASALKDAW
jgi:hypothetical protein